MGRATTSDAELVEASRRGERAAFGELVERYQRVVCAVGYSGTRDHALGEDVAQDTFVAAFDQLDQLRDVSRVREWLCGIARNLARKARRVRQREAPIDEVPDVAACSPFEHAREQERDAVVAAALARVPETYREALVLYYCEHRSVPAVASAIGISADAVHQRLSRGRQLVAAEVADLVEHTLERRRTRRNLAAAVLAALPLVVAPAHANASTGGTRMLKLGIATAVVALAGTGYAVHRTRAAAAAESGDHRAPSPDPDARAQGRRRVGVGHAQVRAAMSATLPPALPAAASLAAARPTSYDCAAAATNVAELGTQMSDAPPVMLTRDQVEKMRGSLGGSNVIVIEAGSADPAGDLTAGLAAQTAAFSAQFGAGFEQQCLAEHWPQSLIDCLATAADPWSASIECATGAAGTGPSTAALAAVTDASCTAVGAHVAGLLVVPQPVYDPDSVPAVIIAEMNAQFAAIPAKIAETCTSGDWSEARRRCTIAATSSDALATCQ